MLTEAEVYLQKQKDGSELSQMRTVRLESGKLTDEYSESEDTREVADP